VSGSAFALRQRVVSRLRHRLRPVCLDGDTRDSTQGLIGTEYAIIGTLDESEEWNATIAMAYLELNSRIPPLDLKQTLPVRKA
jgi:hypothetical protein